MELKLLYHLLRRPIRTIKSADLLTYKTIRMVALISFIGILYAGVLASFYFGIEFLTKWPVLLSASLIMMAVFAACFCAMAAAYAFVALVVSRIRSEGEILFTTMFKVTIPLVGLPLCMEMVATFILGLLGLWTISVYVNAAIALLSCVYVYILFAYKLHSKTRAIVAAISWLALWALQWLPMLLK